MPSRRIGNLLLLFFMYHFMVDMCCISCPRHHPKENHFRCRCATGVSACFGVPILRAGFGGNLGRHTLWFCGKRPLKRYTSNPSAHVSLLTVDGDTCVSAVSADSSCVSEREFMYSRCTFCTSSTLLGAFTRDSEASPVVAVFT